MNKKSQPPTTMQRRFSTRLAKKQRINKLPDNYKLEKNLPVIQADECETDQTSVLKDRSKDSRSKYFIDFLELQPVELESSNETSNKDGKINKKSDMMRDVSRKHSVSNCSKRKSRKIVKRCRKLCSKSVRKSGQTTGNENDNTHISDAENKQDTAIVTNNNCSDLNMIHLKPSCEDVVANDICKENQTVGDGKVADLNVTEKGGEINRQIYMFRDVNKIAHGICPNESPADLFVTVDLNRHGKKRRYDKLIKKLVDSEKNLENNLKEVNQEDTKKADVSLCVEKMKEKLRVREKKKYEYLINYMRDQWRVDQKCFQDLLPQKVDLVQENVEKQLGAKMDNIVHEKRKRGRPRKINMEGDKVVDSSSEKKSAFKYVKQRSCHEKKDSDINVSFPDKFPQSLISDTSVSQNRQKMEKFRVGIIDKNGDQEFIELNSETLQGIPSCSTKDSISDTSDKQDIQTRQTTKIRGRQKGAEHCKTDPTDGLTNIKIESPDTSYSNGDGCPTSGPHSNRVHELTLEVLEKYPPTTISLPSISSLERDYELVSLSPPCPAQLGNFYTDHFFIPQSTFDQDGKTSMIIVGPFCLVCDPKPRLLLVSPDERKKGPTMILRRKIHSPSNTPPRDFRIHKESRWVRIPYKSNRVNDRGQQGDPAVIFQDHNYMTPVELRDNVRRYCRAVAKYSANVKFIDARVENITEEADNFVVTIKGDNMLHQVKNVASLSQAPMICNKDGMPVVYNLSQIMTPALIMAGLSAKREQLALQSQQTGDYTPVMFPFSDMGDVVMEVLIPPGGTEFLPRTKNRHLQFLQESPEANKGVSYPVRLEALSDSGEVNFLHQEEVINIEDSPCEEVVQNQTQEELEKNEEQVVVENAEAVDSGPLPGLPCCRMCLRLFPSDYMLFMHVRSSHPACETTDSLYLDELRARSHLACRICCNPPTFLATPAKLKRHLRLNHGIDHYLEICRVCHAEFMDKNELDMHTELCHNTLAGRRLVSLLKPHQMDHLLPGETPLLSGFMFCSRCNVMFNDRMSLLSHTLKAHPDLNRLNSCGLCDRLFESTQSLHKHLKKAHEETHDGALKCPFCPAWLSSMELASIHRITLHTGAVPVHCPFCGAGYQNLHMMYMHVRSQHLQTEVHICPECQASFPTSRLLSEHMRKTHVMSPRILKESSHTACSMTYCCPFCTMAFMRTYDLAVHVINAHRECLLPSQCQLCMQSFVSDVVMRTHMAGAHGIDTSTDATYVDGQFDDDQSVTVVLQDDGEDVYTHPKDLDTDTHGRTLMRGHLMDTHDILDSQEADQYIGLDDQETIVYLTERSHIVGSGEMFGECSTMDDVQLLDDANDDFNFHGVDYLETLTNDSIAVGADVVADVSMDEITSGDDVNEGQANRSQDILELTSQFEIDGVLYELSSEHDSSEVTDVSNIDSSGLRLSCVEASDLAKLWRHANLS